MPLFTSLLSFTFPQLSIILRQINLSCLSPFYMSCILKLVKINLKHSCPLYVVYWQGQTLKAGVDKTIQKSNFDAKKETKLIVHGFIDTPLSSWVKVSVILIFVWYKIKNTFDTELCRLYVKSWSKLKAFILYLFFLFRPKCPHKRLCSPSTRKLF